MVRDPVCGMDLDEKKAVGKSEYDGQVYYFCTANCKRWFDKYPCRYLSQAQTLDGTTDQDGQKQEEH